MKKIEPKFTFEVKKSRRSDRGDLLDAFLLNLNESREKDGYKKMSFGRIAKLLKGKNLYVLFKECERSKNFSQTFWIKIKK